MNASIQLVLLILHGKRETICFSNILLPKNLLGFALICGADYNRFENHRNNSKYGKEWIYFPDANEIPKKVFFFGKDSFGSRIGFDMKESVKFTLYTR